MRLLAAALILLTLLLQARLWFGDGNLLKMWELQEKIEAQEDENRKLNERNRALEAEVRDLKEGTEAIEERARTELGMIKDGETFYQVVGE